MNILLVDADSTIPNLALMKLSRYHKNLGDNVELKQLNISYYPKKRRTVQTIPSGYHKTYCSIVFFGSKEWVSGDNSVVYGGTGYSLAKNLPAEIEDLDPDYSIYPNNDISYGFITRGCIRKCKFCVVPKKEGMIHQVSDIDRIVKHKVVKFLDNNILAFSNHMEILQELIDKKIRCQFNQGLDIRLVNEENSKLLSQLRYFGNYIFAFDNWKYLRLIERGIVLMPWRKDWQIKFFVYVHPDMPLSDTIKRLQWCKNNKCLPYVMRDIVCWNSEYSKFYIDLASYCNQPNLFKKMSFGEFLVKRHITKNSKPRIEQHIKLWRNNQ